MVPLCTTHLDLFRWFVLINRMWTEVQLPLLTRSYQFSSVQSLSPVRLCATPWIAACQDSLSITNSLSSLRLTSLESVMPSSHLILCHPLLLLPPLSPSISVFSNESALRMRWPKYWSFSFIVSFLRLFSLPCCCCSDVKSCLALCDPMGCSMPGSPAFHYFLKFAQICVQWVSDTV